MVICQCWCAPISSFLFQSAGNWCHHVFQYHTIDKWTEQKETQCAIFLLLSGNMSRKLFDWGTRKLSHVHFNLVEAHCYGIGKGGGTLVEQSRSSLNVKSRSSYNVTDEDLRGRNVLHYHPFKLLRDCSTSASPPCSLWQLTTDDCIQNSKHYIGHILSMFGLGWRRMNSMHLCNAKI